MLLGDGGGIDAGDDATDPDFVASFLADFRLGRKNPPPKDDARKEEDDEAEAADDTEAGDAAVPDILEVFDNTRWLGLVPTFVVTVAATVDKAVVAVPSPKLGNVTTSSSPISP